MSSTEEPLEALLELMARLRDPRRGCPWDRAQTFATIAPYTIEEAYEVRDAIERGSPGELRDELGDLLFQVVFHARMAEERGWFDFAAVARAIHAKLIRRHPHVFGPQATESADAGQLARSWEDHKASERAEVIREGSAAPGALGRVADALPALMRAAKLGKRAARVGFDWTDAAGVRRKVTEELGELDTALAGMDASGGAAAAAEELGDTLFALANLGRHLGLDAEETLRAANYKFERRFAAAEALGRARGLPIERLTGGEWEALWCEVKTRERSRHER